MCRRSFLGRLSRVVDATSVSIGSSSQGLLLTWAPSKSTVDQVSAELRDEGLHAAQIVYHGYATGFRDLVDFFMKLERDWRGWDGVRTWESLEGDLRIEARHAYGHVQLRVTLRHSIAVWGRAGWIATADLTVEPGEQLSAVARDLRAIAPS